MTDNPDKIIKEQVYAFERLVRFCLFNYKQECKKFEKQLAIATQTAHVADGNSLRKLIILADILNNELGRDDLWECVHGHPLYIKELLQKYKILPKSVVIFPNNRIKAYKVSDDIVINAIRCIKNREKMIKRSVKINDHLLCVSSVPDTDNEFTFGNKCLNGDFLIGLDGNYLADCPYSLESVKYLVKQND